MTPIGDDVEVGALDGPLLEDAPDMVLVLTHRLDNISRGKYYLFHGKLTAAPCVDSSLLIAAVAPLAWGTTYLVTESFLPPDRPLFAALARALPAGLFLAWRSTATPTGRGGGGRRCSASATSGCSSP